MENLRDYIPLFIAILTTIAAFFENRKNKELTKENVSLKAKINEKI